jgi:ribosomal-protein-alanine N-acetyltransferase
METSPYTNLTTDRLFLRDLRVEDAEEIFRLRSDESVNQFVDRQRAVTIGDAIEFIQKIQTLTKHHGSVMWAITLIGEAKLIGTVVYWNIVKEKCQAELGYELLPEYQGKGIMAEALKKVIEFGFDELKFKTIVAEPNKANIKSIKLLEKLGFELIDRDGDKYLIYSCGPSAKADGNESDIRPI